MAEQTPTKGALSQLGRLMPYLRRYRRLVLLGLLCITVSNVCSTTIPRVIGASIDALKSPTVSTSDVVWLLASVLALTIGSGYFMFATRRTIIVASRRIEEDLRNDFVLALRLQSQSFYQERSTGSILAHASNDIAAVREFIGPAIMYSANTVTTFAFAFTWMVALHGWLTAAIVVPIPFIAFTTYKLGRRIHARYKVVQEEYEHVTTHAQETFSGVRVVRAFAQEHAEAERFADISRSYYLRNMGLAKVQALMMPAMSLLFNLSYVLVISVGGWLITRNELTVGQLTQFFIYLNQLLWPIAAIGWVTSMIQRGAASISRLAVIIDHVPSIRDTNQTDTSILSLQGSIEFKDVSLAFGSTSIFDSISFSVPAGATLGIVGSVGSGKSTLVNLIPRIHDATAGTVLIDGSDVQTIPLGVLRSRIAVVPQESFLFSTSIKENIRFGRPDASDEEVYRAARVAQLESDVAELPIGFDTVVGERGITLSGGQKQRTALARAILNRPAILVLDDALSAIDTDTEDRIREGLRGVTQGRTTIIIAHRVSTVQHCSHILVLENGEVAERGTHEELLARHGLYAAMYSRQLLEQEVQA